MSANPISGPSSAISKSAAKFLQARGLDVDLCERLGVTSAKGQSGAECIVFPYERGGIRVNRKIRKIDAKEFIQDKGGEQILWRLDCIADVGLKDEPVVITEGEFDCIAAIQAGYWRSVSVPGGAPPEAHESEKDLRASARYACIRSAPLDDVACFILATDNDAKGIALRTDLIALLHPARCKFVTYPAGCKDLNDVLRDYGQEVAAKVLASAQWVAVSGVLEPDELPELGELIVWRPQVLEPIDRLVSVCPGHVSVWTGLAGDGKSTLVNAVMWTIADRYGLKVAAATFESTPQREYWKDLVNFRGLGEAEAKVWWRKHIVFIYADGFEPGTRDPINATIDWFLDAAETAVRRYGCRIIVLDPWSQIDHDLGSFEREDQYVRRVLKAFKRFARHMDVHVAIVAHPAKPKRNTDGTYPIPEGYDISGAAHWKNAPDLGMTAYRDPPLIPDPDNEGRMIPDPHSTRVLIKAWKVKFHRDMNPPGEVYASLDRRTGRYVSAEHWEDKTFPRRSAPHAREGNE